MFISSKTKEYASGNRSQEQDKTGEYFPDSVVDPFIRAVRAIMPGTFQKTLTDPAAFASMKDDARDIAIVDTETGKTRQLSLNESKVLVVTALKDYDPALGEKAEKILNDRLETRKLADVPEGEQAQQQYVARRRKTPQGTADQHAGNIRYDYLNGTIDDPIMLAHEVGHAIADDYICEKGLASSDFRESIPETQAYFVQHIVYDYLRNHGHDEGIRRSADLHFTATMTRNIYNLAISDVARDAQIAMKKGDDFNADDALTARFGTGWEQYEWAREVRDNIDAAQWAQKNPTISDTDRKMALDKLDDEVRYMHGRPMSILTALALQKQASETDEATKCGVIGALLGRKGLQNIVCILSEGGINYGDQMEKHARAAIKSSMESIYVQQSACHNTSPSVAGNRPQTQMLS